MKTRARGLLLCLIFFTASLAYGAVPRMKVTVFNSNRTVAFTGTTDSNGSFVTERLAPGNYIVQFNSIDASDPAYAVVVSAGNKKVLANGVSGKMFAGGGVAMRVNVGNGLNITGQVASGGNAGGSIKILGWGPTKLGRSRPAHWAGKGAGDEVQA